MNRRRKNYMISLIVISVHWKEKKSITTTENCNAMKLSVKSFGNQNIFQIFLSEIKKKLLPTLLISNNK